MNYGTVSTEEFDKLRQSHEQLPLIDVRTDEEYVEVHAENTIHIPLDELSRAKVQEKLPDVNLDEADLYFICRSGGRSGKACEMMMEQGLERVHNVLGGTLDWVAKGLPTD